MTAAEPSPPSLEEQLAAVLLQAAPGEAARAIERAPTADSVALLGVQPAHVIVHLLDELTPERAASLLAELAEPQLRVVLPLLNTSRAAALIARMPEDARARCFSAVDEGAARELQEIASYPPDTAGALMDPEVNAFHSYATVAEVMARLREGGRSLAQDIFIVGENDTLVGSIPILDVALEDPARTLDSFERGPLVKVEALAPREVVVELLEGHLTGSLPVVDFHGHLVGVLRQSELVTAAQDAATANALKMVGAGGAERALSSPWMAVKKRLPWLQINLLTAFLAAAVVGLFEGTIAKVTALAVMLPVVAGQSGNTGAQALAVTMRGLALREIRPRDFLAVVSKEGVAGAANGLAVAMTTCLAVYLWSGSAGLTGVIGVSMVFSMALAGISGATIPIVLIKLGQDPAQSSSIVLTTVTDVVGFFSFLGIATLFMAYL